MIESKENLTDNFPLSKDAFFDIINKLDSSILSEIEKEFNVMIKIWKKKLYLDKSIKDIIHERKSTLQEIIQLNEPWNNKEDSQEVKKLVSETVQESRQNILNELYKKIQKAYYKLPKDIQEILNNSLESSNIFVIATIILLEKIWYKQNEVIDQEDKKAIWINLSVNKIEKIFSKIKKIESLIKKSIDKEFCNIFFEEVKRMIQETFATLIAIGCHIYIEDCSVIIWPVKIKNTWWFNSKQWIDQVINYTDRLIELNWKEPFYWIQKYFDNKENIKEMQKGSFLIVPIIVDANDIQIYLWLIDNFYSELVKVLDWKKSKEFKIFTRKIWELWGQPRIKFQMTNQNKFNIRLDYNEKNNTIEIDVGWIDFKLNNWKSLIEALSINMKKIVGDTYKRWWWINTNRIGNNNDLIIEEQIALIHSVMMTQWCSILWREQNRMFWYHYKLISWIDHERFNKIISIFKK